MNPSLLGLHQVARMTSERANGILGLLLAGGAGAGAALDVALLPAVFAGPFTGGPLDDRSKD